MFRPHLKTAKQLFFHPLKKSETWTLHTFRYESRLFFVRGWCFSSHFIHFSIFYLPRTGRGSSDTWHLTNPQYFTNRSPHDGNPIEATIHPTYSISITQYIFAQNIQVISFWGKCNFLSKWWEENKLLSKRMMNTPRYCHRCFCFHSNIPTVMAVERNNRNHLFVTFNLISFSVLCRRGISAF